VVQEAYTRESWDRGIVPRWMHGPINRPRSPTKRSHIDLVHCPLLKACPTYVRRFGPWLYSRLQVFGYKVSCLSLCVFPILVAGAVRIEPGPLEYSVIMLANRLGQPGWFAHSHFGVNCESQQATRPKYPGLNYMTNC
jgi:hypothetical protein